MASRTLALVLAGALAPSLAAIPAAAQGDTVTVRYTWLSPASPAGHTRGESALMLACPAGGGGAAYLSLVQPLATDEASEGHLFRGLSGSGRALFYTRLGSTDPQRQAGLDSARAALAAGRNGVFSGPGGSVRLVHVPFADSVAVPAGALAGFPRSLTLSAGCSDGLPSPLLAGDTPGGAMGLGRIVQAGDYVFARRLAGTAPAPPDRLENALVGMLDAAAQSLSITPEPCASPVRDLTVPLANARAVQARRRPVMLVQSDAANRPWLVTNGTLETLSLDVELALAPSTAGELRVRGGERRLEVPPCGQRQIALAARGGAASDRLAVARTATGIAVTIAPAGAAAGSGLTRVAKVAGTEQGLSIVLEPGGGWGKWLPWVLVLGLLLAGVLGWLLARFLRRRARDRRFADRAVYFVPEEIHHPVEFALALQGVLRRRPYPPAPGTLGQGGQTPLSQIRETLPRRLREFRLPDENWRLDLWSMLKREGHLNRLSNQGWSRHSAGTWEQSAGPQHGNRRTSRVSQAWARFQLTPLDEAVILYALQQDQPVLDTLDSLRREDVKGFPDGEEVPPWLPVELADAVNHYLDRGETSRDALVQELPRYLSPDSVAEAVERQDGAGGTETPSASTVSAPADGSPNDAAQIVSRTAADGASLAQAAPSGSPTPAAPVADADAASAAVPAAPAEISTWLERLQELAARLDRPALFMEQAEQLEEERRRASDLEIRSRLLGERVQGLTGRIGDVVRAMTGRPGAEEPHRPHSAEAGEGDAALLRDLEEVPARLEALYRGQAARLYRVPEAEVGADAGTPLLDRFGRLERVGAEYARLRAGTPRAARIGVLAGALDDAGQALGALGEEPSLLANTDLVPRALSARLRSARAETEAYWHAALLAAAEAAVDHGDEADGAEIYRRFMEWLLENTRAQLLTHMLRLREVISVYCRDAALPEAQHIHTLGGEYVRACDAVVQVLRGLGVYLDPISFLEPPPEREERRFETKWGRPLIFDSHSLQEIVVSRLRDAGPELSDTIADVSDWGYACPGLPISGKPTRGWLCRGLADL